MAFVLILLCLGAGYSLRRGGVLAEGSHFGLNAWLVYMAVPAAALLHIPRIIWNADMAWPVIMPCLVWAGSFLVLGRTLGLQDRATRGALVLGGGLCNTSFVGFPLVTAYYGEAGLKIAVVCDQASFLLLSTVGVATALSHGAGERRRGIVAGLLRFPPFLAFMAALLLPQWVSYGELPKLWEALANTLVPVALFSVGAQLEVSAKAFDKTLSQGVSYKLLLAPAIVLGVLYLGGASGLVAKVTVLEAAMASMATTSVLAVQYGLNTRVSNLMIGVGVPISLLTTYGWYRLLERIF